MTRYGDTDDLPTDLRDLSVDDRLDQSAIARVAGMWNEAADDRRIVLVTTLLLTEDVHSALAVAPDDDLMLRVSCHARGQAMTQRERDWKIRDIGDDIETSDAEIDIIPDAVEPGDVDEYVRDWVETVIGDRLIDPEEYRDELHMEHGSRLRLYQPFGPTRAYCRLRLTMADEAP